MQCCTPGVWRGDFLPIFSADPPCQVGWLDCERMAIFRSFHRCSIGFKSGLWLSSLKDIRRVVPEPLLHRLGWELRVTAQLEGEHPVQSKVLFSLRCLCVFAWFSFACKDMYTNNHVCVRRLVIWNNIESFSLFGYVMLLVSAARRHNWVFPWLYNWYYYDTLPVKWYPTLFLKAHKHFQSFFP